jgi:hypothetical protein
VAFGRVPAALRLDLRAAAEALTGLRIVQDRIVGVDRVLGVDVTALGGGPVLLKPGPGAGIAIRCLVHIGLMAAGTSTRRLASFFIIPRRRRRSPTGFGDGLTADGDQGET